MDYSNSQKLIIIVALYSCMFLVPLLKVLTLHFVSGWFGARSRTSLAPLYAVLIAIAVTLYVVALHHIGDLFWGMLWPPDLPEGTYMFREPMGRYGQEIIYLGVVPATLVSSVKRFYGVSWTKSITIVFLSTMLLVIACLVGFVLVPFLMLSPYAP